MLAQGLDADAGRDVDLRRVEIDGDVAHRPGQGRREAVGLNGRDIGQEDCELIPADAADRIGDANSRGESAGDAFEQSVSGLVTIGVVDVRC